MKASTIAILAMTTTLALGQAEAADDKPTEVVIASAERHELAPPETMTTVEVTTPTIEIELPAPAIEAPALQRHDATLPRDPGRIELALGEDDTQPGG